MKILVACEESQAVTKELRALGHEAFSCDIIPCSGGHDEWHIMQDVLPLLNGCCHFKTLDGLEHYIEKWDMIIAFPPCTYLSNAGARHLYKGGILNIERYEKGMKAKDFFMKFWNAPCERIAIENPTPSKIYELPPKTQVIQPWQFGHPFTKRTQLWLKGHGVRLVYILKDIEGCLQKTEQKIEARLFRVLQKLWQNNGQ